MRRVGRLGGEPEIVCLFRFLCWTIRRTSRSLSGGLEVDYVSIFVYYGSTKIRLGESLVCMWTVCSRIGICTLPLAQCEFSIAIIFGLA